MAHAYKWLLIAGFFAVPLLVVTVDNDFRSRSRTAVRALAALIAGWAWLLACTLLVTRVDSWLATSQEELDRITDGDGAKHVAVLLLGWVPTAFVVLVYLFGVSVVRVRRRRRARRR